MPRTVFYPGSFDPVTFGHLDLIGRAGHLFDRIVVGIGVHHGKKALFSDEERVAMLREEIGKLNPAPLARVEIVTFDGLAVDCARAHGAVGILRGLRDASDFDYEMQMAGMNGAMAPGLESIFLPAASGNRHIAATFVRQIAQMGGDISPFVPEAIALRLRQKLNSPSTR